MSAEKIKYSWSQLFYRAVTAHFDKIFLIPRTFSVSHIKCKHVDIEKSVVVVLPKASILWGDKQLNYLLMKLTYNSFNICIDINRRINYIE